MGQFHMKAELKYITVISGALSVDGIAGELKKQQLFVVSWVMIELLIIISKK